jgi:hypothetical protein
MKPEIPSKNLAASRRANHCDGVPERSPTSQQEYADVEAIYDVSAGLLKRPRLRDASDSKLAHSRLTVALRGHCHILVGQ